MVDASVSHIPGPLKQRNKSHKCGKHRSKKQLSKINKNSTDIKISNGPKLSKKQERVLQKKQKINEKKSLTKSYHSKVGYSNSPITITVISTDTCFSLENLTQLFKENHLIINETNSNNSFYLFTEKKCTKIQFLVPDTSNVFNLYDCLRASQAIWLLSMDKNDEIDESLMNMLNIFKFITLPIIYHIKKLSNELNSKQIAKLKKEYEKKLNQFIRLDNRFFIFSEEKMAENLIRLCVPASSFNSKKILKDDNAIKDSVTLVTDFISFVPSNNNETGLLTLTGYLRGGSTSANRFIHLPGYGEFPIVQISKTSHIISNSSNGECFVSSFSPVEIVSTRTNALIETTETDPNCIEEEYDELIKNPKIKSDQLLFDPVELTEKFDLCTLNPSHGSSSEEEIESEIDDLDTNDCELDAKNPSDIPARFRLNEYQDMNKILDSWNDRMKGPPEYSKIIRFSNFSHASKISLNSTETDSVLAGSYISITIGDVPLSVYAEIFSSRQYPIAYILYPHEEKMTVCNYFIYKKDDSPTILSNKKYIFICGPRRFSASCILSAASKASKHKFLESVSGEAFLVATLYAPVTFPPSNVLMFDQDESGELLFIGSGHVLRPDPSRLILSQNILEGSISKVFKKSVIVRNMFNNREDVEYFIGSKLVTKNGTKGHILKPIGTHGNMRCFFDLPSIVQETVQMPLYKREYPIWDIDMSV